MTIWKICTRVWQGTNGLTRKQSKHVTNVFAILQSNGARFVFDLWSLLSLEPTSSITVETVAMFSVAPVPATQWSWPLIRSRCAFVTRVIRYSLHGSPHNIRLYYYYYKTVFCCFFFISSTALPAYIVPFFLSPPPPPQSLSYQVQNFIFTFYLFKKRKLFNENSTINLTRKRNGEFIFNYKYPPCQNLNLHTGYALA